MMMMFDRYVTAKDSPRTTWKRTLIGASLALHGVAVLALMVQGFWQIEALALPKQQATLVMPLALPKPPVAVAPSIKQETRRPQRVRPQVPTQPINAPVEEVEPEISFGPAGNRGTESGVGSPFGIRGGVSKRSCP